MAIWFAVNNIVAFCFITKILNFESEICQYLFSIITLVISLCGFCMLHLNNKYVRLLKYLIAGALALLLWSFMFEPLLFGLLFFYIVFNYYAVFQIDTSVNAIKL